MDGGCERADRRTAGGIAQRVPDRIQGHRQDFRWVVPQCDSLTDLLTIERMQEHARKGYCLERNPLDPAMSRQPSPAAEGKSKIIVPFC